MVINNEKAHQMMRSFATICEEYNNHELENLSPTMLEVTQSFMIDCLDLIKFLKLKDDCEATRAYEIFAKKILLRLSYLIHHGRVETLEETTTLFFGRRHEPQQDTLET